MMAASTTPSTTIFIGSPTFLIKTLSMAARLSQTVGTMVLRFADADVLPYDFTDFADTIHKYSTS